MMYFFLGFDGLGIMFSDIKERNGKKQIRVYADDTDTSDKIHELEMWLPDYEITMNKGFTPEKVAEVKEYVKNGSDDIWDIAEHGY